MHHPGACKAPAGTDSLRSGEYPPAPAHMRSREYPPAPTRCARASETGCASLRTHERPCSTRAHIMKTTQCPIRASIRVPFIQKYKSKAFCR